jgi:hypothetical protein
MSSPSVIEKYRQQTSFMQLSRSQSMMGEIAILSDSVYNSIANLFVKICDRASTKCLSWPVMPIDNVYHDEGAG